MIKISMKADAWKEVCIDMDLLAGVPGEWNTLASSSVALLWPPPAQVTFFLTNFKVSNMNICRDCVQTFAMASGVEHFKCPNCNNKELIAKVFQKIGIYVPQKVNFSDV